MSFTKKFILTFCIIALLTVGIEGGRSANRGGNAFIGDQKDSDNNNFGDGTVNNAQRSKTAQQNQLNADNDK